MYLIQGIVLLLLSIRVQSRSIRVFVNGTSEEIDDNNKCPSDTVSAIIERANKNAGKPKGDFTIIHGDIAVYTGLQNADPCTACECRWPRNSDGKVYVPYVISSQYPPSEIDVIRRAMDSFQKSTCIRFISRTNEVDYINIISDIGCYSYVGRIGGQQNLSLHHLGCVYHKTVQHELLHALGFHHEQSRSDRDEHVKILFENVRDGEEGNFEKVNTNNLNTPYDYNSIMHYGRCAFSKNDKPTIIPIPDNNVPIGLATQMSPNDILRVNRLYCT
ncbi:low choriolytic enzyme-like [Silurus meridionalis]|uniref:low choriolytic enzyme-like n=1 Tax=Silurus meridionalis TaxID=175797 RepID=UPI001EE9FBEA|nr:low choriolytic enzyme-like [Silurus meridionalis]